MSESASLKTYRSSLTHFNTTKFNDVCRLPPTASTMK